MKGKSFLFMVMFCIVCLIFAACDSAVNTQGNNSDKNVFEMDSTMELIGFKNSEIAYCIDRTDYYNSNIVEYNIVSGEKNFNYDSGYFSAPDISDNIIVWSWSECSNGKEFGNCFAYDLDDCVKQQISNDNQTVWPSVSNKKIVARVKPDGENQGSYLVIKKKLKKAAWDVIVSPSDKPYRESKYEYVEIMKPTYRNKYIAWEDNLQKSINVFDVEENKIVTLAGRNDGTILFNFIKMTDEFICWRELNTETNESVIKVMLNN